MLRVLIPWLSALSCFAATDLEHRIDALLESSAAVERAHAGVHVVELATGKTLYRHNEDRLFLPASNMKLFTSALALTRLGPDYRFVTRLLLEPTGDLVLCGSGDPSLSGRVYPYQKTAPKGPPLQAIDDLAEQAVAAGLRRVDGDVAGDDRLYPWSPYAPSWTQDDAVHESGAPVSALSVNDNIVTLLLHPGTRAGEPVDLSLEPPLEYFSIDNRLTTAARASEPNVRLSRLPGSAQLLLSGSVPAGNNVVREDAAIDDPALYAATALYDALTRRGVVITGRPVARHRAATRDYEPPVGDLLASRSSPPLDQLLQLMDKVSQNLHAELMLREVGRIKRRAATREAGLAELSALLAEIGAPASESRLEDGSGLSRNTLLSPRLVTRLLANLQMSKYREAWLALWPVGGDDGTLQHRLTDGIRAKTGSLSRALALSGYAQSKSHGLLAFSILVNDFSAPPDAVRAWIDKIAVALLD